VGQAIQALELYMRTYPNDFSPRVNLSVAYQMLAILTKA